MKKRGKNKVDKNDYSEATVKAKRKLPKRNIIILSILVVIQIALVLVSVWCIAAPDDATGQLNTAAEPDDVIEQYNVTATPRAHGSLDILYDITWRAVSDSEPLSWVRIGIPNDNAELYDYSVSDNVESAKIVSRKSGESYVRLDFKDEYIDGEVVHFGFEINQRDMLVGGANGYFYELVPGWFNEIPVEHYRFSWDADASIAQPDGSRREDGCYVFEGSLTPGGYKMMRVAYSESRFSDGVSTVEYKPFDTSEAYNALESDNPLPVIAILFAVLIIIPEVYIIDSFVSYGRGRGFITEKGHPVHTYGTTNPAYLAAMHAANTNNRTHRGGRGGSGGSGGGCACACACACAGGGRAGCSAKARGVKE